MNELNGWDLGIAPLGKWKRPVILPGKGKCIVCGRSITDREWQFYRTCDNWKCRNMRWRRQHADRERRNERVRRHNKSFEERVYVLRDRAAVLQGIENQESYTPALVPALQRALTRLPDVRRSALSDHLNGLIAEARKEPMVSTDERLFGAENGVVPEMDSLSFSVAENACGTCRGFCCVNGRDHAYLTVETINHCWENYPQLEAHDVHSVFLSHIKEWTFENSCIFHSQNGCSLPRELRSNTCNEFGCHQLNQLLKRMQRVKSHQTFYIAMEKRIVVRYTFVRAEQKGSNTAKTFDLAGNRIKASIPEVS